MKQQERGFALLFVIAMACAVAIMLYMEMPRLIFEAQRNKEDTLLYRGEQYQRAIGLFVKKNKKWPQTLDELEDFNGVRYLRRRYKDPLTDKDEWRLIHTNGMMLTDSLVQKPQDPMKGGKDGQGNPQQAQGGFGSTFGSQPSSGIGSPPGFGQQPQQPQQSQAAWQPVPGAPGLPGQDGPQQLWQQRRASDRPASAPGNFANDGNLPPEIAAELQNQLQNQDQNPQAENGDQQQPFVPNPGLQPGETPQQVQPGIYFPNQPGVNQPGQVNSGQPLYPGQTVPPGVPGYVPQGQPGTPGYNPNQPGQANPGQPFYPGQTIPPGVPGYVPQGQPGTPGYNPNQPGVYQQGQPVYPGQQVNPAYPANPVYNPAQNTGPNAGYNPQPGITNPPYRPPGSYPNTPGGAAPAPNTSGFGSRPPTPTGFGTGAAQNPALGIIQQSLTNARPNGLAGLPGQQGAAGMGGMGPGIAGVASTAEGEGIKIYNERRKYKEWEFVYDMTKDPAITGPQGAMAQQPGNQQNQQNQNTGSGFGGSFNSGFGSQGGRRP